MERLCQLSAESEQGNSSEKASSELVSDKKFVCEDCGYSTSQCSHLKQHKLTHSADRQFCCAQCHTTFKHPHYLKRHMRIHSGERPYSCKDCGVRFTHYYSWQTHAKTHTGEKPHLCTECGLAFSEPSNLQRHRQTHSGERPYLCSQCGVAFARAGNLKTHMQIHSGEKPFSCRLCPATFSRLTNMELHMRSHSGEKPFQCHDCGAKLSSSGALKTHRRIHTGERPFSCDNCDSSFRQISHLQKHLKNHHVKVPQLATTDMSGIGDAPSQTNCTFDPSIALIAPSDVQVSVVQTVQRAGGGGEQVCSSVSAAPCVPGIVTHHPVQSLSVSEQSCLQSLVMMRYQEAQPHITTHMLHPQPLIQSAPVVSAVTPVPYVVQDTIPVQQAMALQWPGRPVSSVLQSQTIPVSAAALHGKQNPSFMEAVRMLQQTVTKTQGVDPGFGGKCADAGMENPTLLNDGVYHRIVSPEAMATCAEMRMENQAVFSDRVQYAMSSTHREDQPMSSALGNVFHNVMSGQISTDLQAQKLYSKMLVQRENEKGKCNGDLAFAKSLPFEVAVSGKGYNWMKIHCMPGDQQAQRLFSQIHTSGQGCSSSQGVKPSAKEGAYITVDGEMNAELSACGSGSEGLENSIGDVSIPPENAKSSSSQPEADSNLTCFAPSLLQTVEWRADMGQGGVHNTQCTPSVKTGLMPYVVGSVQQLFVHSADCRETLMADVSNGSEPSVLGSNIGSEKPGGHTSNNTAVGETVQQSPLLKLDSTHEERKTQDKDKRFVCPHCSRGFTRAGNLKAHLITHTGEKPFTCDQCQTAFNRPWNLKLHKRSHLREKAFVCKYCSLSLSTAGALKTHVTIHTGEKPFSCHVCEASFRLVRQLQKHAATHHSVASAGPVSGAKFLTKKKASSHAEGTASFQNKKPLKTPRKGSSRQKLYECRECGLQFTERSNRQRHMLIHTGERPFLCAQCGAAFARAGNLKSHLTIHSGHKPFSCHKCNAKFNRSWNLKLHLRSHTGEKAFPCLECWANLSSSSALKTHMRIHTGEKPFDCKSCGATFRQCGQLQKHIKIHHTFTELFAATISMTDTC